jgi:hypothetical protein
VWEHAASAIVAGGDMAAGLRPGTPVEVRTAYDRGWARGFEVVAIDDDGCHRVRRLSDGMELPTPFPPGDVRRARRDDAMWWI